MTIHFFHSNTLSPHLPSSSRSSTVSLPSSPASTLLLVNPNCPVHNNNNDANNDDMFEDEEEDDENFFLQRLHPLQVIVHTAHLCCRWRC